MIQNMMKWLLPHLIQIIQMINVQQHKLEKKKKLGRLLNKLLEKNVL
jgi:hypothetical protein